MAKVPAKAKAKQLETAAAAATAAVIAASAANLAQNAGASAAEIGKVSVGGVHASTTSILQTQQHNALTLFNTTIWLGLPVWVYLVAFVIIIFLIGFRCGRWTANRRARRAIERSLFTQVYLTERTQKTGKGKFHLKVGCPTMKCYSMDKHELCAYCKQIYVLAKAAGKDE
jgi:hypothetical protein